MIDFIKALPGNVLDFALHPPLRPDPTIENGLIGLGAIALVLLGVWLWNRR